MEFTRFEELPDVMSINVAARFLGISRNSAYEAARRKELPSVRIGARILVSKQALGQLLSGIASPVAA